VIQCILEIDKQKRYLKELIVKGHSNFSVKGSDIVCSGVSTLVYTIIELIIPIKGVKTAFKDIGDLLFNLKVEDDRCIIEIKYYTNYLITGLKLIEDKYKDYLKLTIKGV